MCQEIDLFHKKVCCYRLHYFAAFSEIQDKCQSLLGHLFEFFSFSWIFIIFNPPTTKQNSFVLRDHVMKTNNHICYNVRNYLFEFEKKLATLYALIDYYSCVIYLSFSFVNKSKNPNKWIFNTSKYPKMKGIRYIHLCVCVKTLTVLEN